MSGGYPSVTGWAFLGFALRDSAGGAQGRGGAHEGRRARGWVLPNLWLQRSSERPRAAMSSPTPLPFEIHRSAQRGELQKVVKWLRKGGWYAGEHDTHPEPQPSQHDPRLQRGGIGGFDSITIAMSGRPLTP